MKRRELIIAWAGSLAPLTAFAQPRERHPWRVGLLWQQSDGSTAAPNLRAFREGMRELGHVEGRTFTIEQRFGASTERLSQLAAELVAANVDVILAAGEAARAAASASRTVPMVVQGTSDPIAEGYAKTLARPGGNITGLTTGSAETNAKQLELLATAISKVTRVGVIRTTAPNHERLLKALDPAAHKLNVKLLDFAVRSEEEIDRAMAAMAEQHASAVIIFRSGYLNAYAPRIAAQAIKHRLASISAFDQYAEAGGLMSYGDDAQDRWRRSAAYVDKILKGMKPGDIPFEQPTRFRLAINNKTAKALGIVIPQSLLLRADKLIE